MMNSSWLYEFILLIHSLSLIGYIMYFISSNWKIKRVSFWLFVTVWTMQTISIIFEMFVTKSFPIMNLNDGIYFYAWILLTFTFMLNRFLQVHFIVLFANVFAYFMMALSILDRKSTRLNSSHVAISYAVFCLKKKINEYHEFYLIN